MFQVARQYKNFCDDMWRTHQKTPLPAVTHLMKLNAGLIEASRVKEGDPEFGTIFATIQESSFQVVKAMSQSKGWAKLPPVPEAIHLFRTALRQPSIAAKVAKEISRDPYNFASAQPS